MRPKYETEKDRANERRIMAEAAAALGMVAVPCENNARQDFFLMAEGGLYAVAEAKCRKHHIGRYQDLMISINKIRCGLEAARIRKVPFLLVVEFTGDGLYKGTRQVYVHRFKQGYHYGIWPGGRRDRHDPYDEEICLFIPICLFETLEEFNARMHKVSRSGGRDRAAEGGAGGEAKPKESLP